MKMIAARNLTTHTYDPETAQTVADEILNRFYPAFAHMTKKFTDLVDHQGIDL